MSPPEHGLVLTVDEKSQIQALDRTASFLPVLLMTPERRTYNYIRHGTTSLFAAYDLASGSVIASTTAGTPAVGQMVLTRAVVIGGRGTWDAYALSGGGRMAVSPGVCELEEA
jgi:hypothetical protein